MKKVLLLLILICSFIGITTAQTRNPFEQATNNEDEVIHIEQWQQHASRPGELLVKFHDYSDIKLAFDSKGKATNRFISQSKSLGINAVLDSFVVDTIEQLIPNFKMPKQPRVSKSYGGSDVVERDMSQWHLIRLEIKVENGERNEYELMDALKKLSEVEYVEPNYLVYALGAPESMEQTYSSDMPADATAVNEAHLTKLIANGTKSAWTPNDPLYSQQWGIAACKIDSLLTAPKLDSTWRPIIAIIDTGVDIDHSDLSANIWTNPSESEGAAGQDDDNNGFVDDVHGWDFVNQTADMHDFNSHGTHCAGIAGAVTNNGIGIAGACPDALIMPISVMQSNGSGDVATIIRGINYAAQNGADIISMSFGTYTYSIALEQALAQAYQTAVLVAAAGNDAIGMFYCPPFGSDLFPAVFTFVFGVQATNYNGGLADFSNYDCTGPSYSVHTEEQLYNYELSAPGVQIVSTVPNGQYRSYNGTSMATPLVAGGIASLLQRRNYPTKEILFGDLINYSQEFEPVDFWTAYKADSLSPTVLQCVAIEINDTANGDGSYYADAGEHLQLYPTIRTVWGPADSVEIWLEFQEFEDTNTIHILQNHVQLGHPISSYAKAKSLNPIDIMIDSTVVDGRNICLVIFATTPTSVDTLRHDFVIKVTNGVKLHGMLTHNDTLWPNVQYIVTDNFAILEGVELVIKPGTTLKIADGVSIANAGKIYAVGSPDSMITFTKTDLGQGYNSIHLSNHDTLGYCIFEWSNMLVLGSSSQSSSGHTGYGIPLYGQNDSIQIIPLLRPIISNSIIRNNFDLFLANSNCYLKKCSIHQNRLSVNSMTINHIAFTGRFFYTINSRNITYIIALGDPDISYNNIINNNCYNSDYFLTIFNEKTISEVWPWGLNIFNNNSSSNNINFGFDNGEIISSISPRGLYLGTSKETLAREHVYDFEYPNSGTFGYVDLSYMEHIPFHEAHGIVWKVEVNGFDAQDEFDSIIPLGVGTHEFKVYFNRVMDTSVTPMLAMGVRPPYTQTAIGENAYWSEDSTIWTAHVTLTGRSAIDGLNRIYVANAQDDEHFEIPYENQRFNVYVSSSGSMSAGFQATPGIGKIDLEWNDQEVNYDDFLGFNIYRYQYDSLLTNYHYESGTGYVYDTVWGPTDTILLNRTLVQDTTYTDFDVIPGERYYYFYKILSTSLTENSPSKTVSAIPNSSIRGDANGSYSVDIADVITTINFVTGQNPQPFLFEAADVNGDGQINVLDIVGIINIILYGDQGSKNEYEQQIAIYTIEDSILYVNTPVALGGLQFNIADCNKSDIELLEAMNGFEVVYANNPDGSLTILAYSMSGKLVPEGKTALLRLGSKTLNDIVLSDLNGHNVIALCGDNVGITDAVTIPIQFVRAFPNPFSKEVKLDIMTGSQSKNLHLVFTDMMGRQVYSAEIETPTQGRYSYTWNAESMPRGIYFATLYINNTAAHTIKLVLK